MPTPRPIQLDDYKRGWTQGHHAGYEAAIRDIRRTLIDLLHLDTVFEIRRDGD